MIKVVFADSPFYEGISQTFIGYMHKYSYPIKTYSDI